MKSPYHKKRLEERNLTNVFGDIIDNESVYIVEFDDERIQMFEQFFNDHYATAGKAIYLEQAESVGDVFLWQVKTSP